MSWQWLWVETKLPGQALVLGSSLLEVHKERRRELSEEELLARAAADKLRDADAEAPVDAERAASGADSGPPVE